ncbi:MAG TPA: hypothetical protein VH723_05285 [Candidatus Limnocylindrales bacterium]|jgi:hypothetical protein
MSQAISTATPASTEPRPRLELDVRATWRRLRMCGWTADEAANLVAHLSGLRVAGRAWTIREVESLLFIRSLVDCGRIVQDPTATRAQDRAA